MDMNQELTDEERLRLVQSIVARAKVDEITGHWALTDRQIDAIFEILPEWMHDEFRKSLDRNMEWKLQKMSINDMIKVLHQQ